MGALGFVGTGFHAQTNLLPAAALADVEIVGLASRSSERSADALARAGSHGRGYGSVADLISGEAGLDRVIVCAQPEDQPAIVRELLEAGIHVLAEKPLGSDAEQARELAEVARAHGVTLRAAFMKRHAPTARRLAELIASDEIGQVLSFAVTFGAEASSFAPTPADFIRLAAIHHVDLVRMLFGEPESVDVKLAGSEAAYSVHVGVTMRSGAIGILRLTNAPAHTSELDVVSVTCERGTVTMTDTQELVVSRGAAGADWRSLQEQQVRLGPSVSTMSGGARDLLFRGFIDEIREFASTDFSGEDGAESNVRTMSFVDAILEQLPVTHGATPTPPSALPG